ncbi:MAG: DUF4105 domain-containing protein [Tannerella sp.]|nr:DUF4105 domain-containing protein [Tannerella sp.]
MRIRIALLLLFAAAFSCQAQGLLSDSARVSLLTCAPSDEAVFTVYGHAALRVVDPVRKMDWVFNYGIFDFNGPGFVYRFAKGETDYRLGVNRFDDFLAEYELRGSGVTEQVLNLTPAERQRVWEALYVNAQPENAVYRYNFFFDNCATRPAAIIEKCVNGKVVYDYGRPDEKRPTFRQLINYYMRHQPWAIFGTELALGSPCDRTVRPHELLFLPPRLAAAFAKALIRTPGGEERPLVSATRQLAPDIQMEVTPTFFTPLLCGWIFFALFAALTFWEWRRKRHRRWPDILLFTLGGLAGCVVFFLAFISTHPATWPNWVLLWLHPLHLVGLLCMAVAGWRAARIYHVFNLCLLAVFFLGWPFLPQTFNPAFFPLAASFALRSAWSLAARRK